MRKRRFSSVFTVLLAVFFLLPAQARAIGSVDTNRDASLRLSYQYGGASVSGVSVSLYRAADVSETAYFTLTGAFAAKPVSVNNLESSAQWNAAAQTLAGYAAADSIPPTAQILTDTQGTAAFTTLKPGLYLVVTAPLTVGNYTYYFAPMLISLPDRDAGGNWLYEVAAYPKGDRTELPSGGDVSYQVVKRWADAGYEDLRPQSVTVDIYQNGVFHTSQVLNAGGDWTFTWSAKDDGSVWQVVERSASKKYTVTVTPLNKSFVVTNVYNPDTSTSPGGSEPGGTDPGGNNPGGSGPPPIGTLPQTGQLWWPVPLLSVGGMLLFAAGWLLHMKEKRKNEGET